MKAWVVDTCVVLDIALNDAAHGVKSAQLLQSKLRDGLVICGVTFVEVSPAFGGCLAVFISPLASRLSWVFLFTQIHPFYFVYHSKL